ncbi:hypothetical protein [Legionella brunensis]|uniref:F-box domain-containing protein n=1 Tax=Legionella brunensis TaxID=29422 RepID=A0A0W0S1C9_9GAMM|nr:hypothetical protein [Legionella brunensis]KTC76977.1 hypothetical protein Lbru_3084 [Legionella brunensis]
MKYLGNREIMQINHSIRIKNEKTIFKRAATAGILLLWNPLKQKNCPNIPTEIGELIGSYLSDNDAKNVVQVCQSAKNAARKALTDFKSGKGKIYDEVEAYLPLSFIP